MKSVKANHLTGKNVIESHGRSVTLFPPLSAAICRDTNWCINTPAKRLLEKRTGKVVAHGRLGWCPTSGTRVLAHQKSTSALKAWSYFRASDLQGSRNDGGLLCRLGTVTFLTLP